MTSEDRDTISADAPDGSRSSSSRAGKGTTKQAGRERRQLPLWQETILLLAVALLLAVVIKAFFVQAFYIPSESMEPGLVRNDRILVEKPSYWGEDGPERGDVVVFKDPGGWLSDVDSAGPDNPVAQAMVKIGLYPAGGHLVKRVIGVGGDTITCCDEQGRLRVNGTPLDEDDHLKSGGQAACNGPMVNQCSGRWRAGPVPEGHVFVMGDNRSRSADSSAHLCRPGAETDCTDSGAYVPVDLVVGRVFVLLWPTDHFTWISRPDGFADVPDAG